MEERSFIMAALTPIQEVRVLLNQSLKEHPLDPILEAVMIFKLSTADKRMQSQIALGGFPHPSMIDTADYAGALLRSNGQHTLALLHHLLDGLNWSVRPFYQESPEAEFGVPREFDNDSIASFGCDCLLMMTIIGFPYVLFKQNRSTTRQLEQIQTRREFNQRILLKQYQIMLSLFQKGSN